MPEMPWEKLADPQPDREYLALATYLPLDKRRSLPGFLRAIRAVQRQLEGSKGLLGYSLRGKIIANKAWTLSLWEDQRSLLAFVREQPHLGVMSRFGAEMGEFKSVRWAVSGSEAPPTWPDALRRLVATLE